jgi:DNA-binding NarL/FixJ family response regulator
METVIRRETATLHAKERFQLTDREHDVVECLAKGWTNKEIAAELGITEPTIKAHIRNIMNKTKCSTRTGIVAQVLHG